MTKINIAYIVENEEDWLPISLESCRWADKILIIDGMSKDKTISILQEMQEKQKNINVIQSPYDHESPKGNGMQRTKYLNYMKQYHPGEWCLVLDADEVLSDDFEKVIKQNIVEVEKNISEGKFGENEDFCMSIKMVHLIDNFQEEDNTLKDHHVPARLFKITDNLQYPLVEHPVLVSKRKLNNFVVENTVIWHYGYARHQTNNLKKYLNHLKKSNMHNKEFLRGWYLNHLFGTYPKRKLNVTLHPTPVKNHFLLTQIEDEMYFRNRGVLESKHLVDAIHWKKHFSPKKVLLCGDGMGHRTQALTLLDVEAGGFDVSEYAVSNNAYNFPEGKYWEQDILEFGLMSNDAFDLVVAYDILEHLEEKDLDTALKNLHGWGNKNFLFSIPFLGDPNLNADPTHKIKKPKAWWIEQIEQHGIKIVSTPPHFWYNHQLLVGRKE